VHVAREGAIRQGMMRGGRARVDALTRVDGGTVAYGVRTRCNDFTFLYRSFYIMINKALLYVICKYVAT